MRNIREFIKERASLSELLDREGGLEIKRFLSLDNQVYRKGALSQSTKELIGLVASLVLRCDDCINYHLLKCHENDVGDAELSEALAIGLVVGGSITIPHLRRTFKNWEDIKTDQPEDD